MAFVTGIQNGDRPVSFESTCRVRYSWLSYAAGVRRLFER